MKAIAFEQPGAADVVGVLELPDPEVGADDVLIRVAYATVNPADYLVRSGASAFMLEGMSSPYVVGWDVSGVIERVGGDVDGWSVGDHVVAATDWPRTHRGGQAELVALPARLVARAPEGLPLDAAASFPMNALTALQGLDWLDVAAGGSLVVMGAAGWLGRFVVQLAELRGLRVFAVARDSDEAELRDLGADELIPRGASIEETIGRIRSLLPDGADGLFDAAAVGIRSADALRDGGSYLAVLGVNGDPGRSIRTHASFVHGDGEQLTSLVKLVEQGQLKLGKVERISIGDGAEAHARMEAGGIRGRLVYDFTR